MKHINCFLYFEKKDEQQMMKQSREEQQKPTTPLISPLIINTRDSPSIFLSETNETCTRSLRDLYETIERGDNITLFFYLSIVNQ